MNFGEKGEKAAFDELCVCMWHTFVYAAAGYPLALCNTGKRPTKCTRNNKTQQ